MKSALGAVLNEVSDVLADSALYLPLALVPGFDPRLIVGIVTLAIIGEMTGVIGAQIGASRRYDGPFGKSDRAFAFGLLALLAGLGVRRTPWFSWLLAGVLVLAAITVWNRARAALREISTK
jgi:CDP-diacylglycerol--glycerol-3-phosphate 3-phosphatidyltransferase